jgi:hypothetical protein
MSFLDQYKQRLADKLAPPTETEETTGPVMHQALVDVVTERAQNQERTQNLIIETFGWDAAATPGECNDIWDNALVESDWTGSEGRDQAARSTRENRTFDRAPKKGEMVIMQGGMGQVVSIDDGIGSVVVRNQRGEEKVFPRDQLTGPKPVNGKLAWALKSAMPRN